jgi:hypothetical protein
VSKVHLHGKYSFNAPAIFILLNATFSNVAALNYSFTDVTLLPADRVSRSRLAQVHCLTLISSSFGTSFHRIAQTIAVTIPQINHHSIVSFRTLLLMRRFWCLYSFPNVLTRHYPQILTIIRWPILHYVKE